MPLPQFTKTSNPLSPFTFEKGRYLPVSEVIKPNQNFSKSGGSAIKVTDHGAEERFREIIINNVSETNRNNLLDFLADSTVNYGQFTFTFIDEVSNSHIVNLWQWEGLDAPRVRGGLYNIRLLLRDVMPPQSVSMPSFSVHQNDVPQVIPDITGTTLNWETKDWDTHDNFDLSTNLFKPTVAGKYLLTASVMFKDQMEATDWALITIKKNGVNIASKNMVTVYLDSGAFNKFKVSGIFEAEVGDYFEANVYVNFGAETDTISTVEVGSPTSRYVYFQGIGISANNISQHSFSVETISTGQTPLNDVTSTLLEWDTKNWDTHDNFDLSTERFTPTKAGIYLLCGSFMLKHTSGMANNEACILGLRKNGVALKNTPQTYFGTSSFLTFKFNVLVEANGTTDYFDMRFYNELGSVAQGYEVNNWRYCYFQGHLISNTKFLKPEFSVIPDDAGQAINNVTATPLEWDTEERDSFDNFNLSTEKFTPTEAGKYYLTAQVMLQTGDMAQGDWFFIMIRKNGVAWRGDIGYFAGTNDWQTFQIDCLVDANGVDDYFDVVVYGNMVGGNFETTQDPPAARLTYFQGIGIP